MVFLMLLLKLQLSDVAVDVAVDGDVPTAAVATEGDVSATVVGGVS